MGFNRNRVIGMTTEELDQFVCQICLDLLTDPVVTQCCRLSYCSECIHDWLSKHNSCPNDRKGLTTDGLKSSERLVFNLLDEMKVKCVYESKGCPEIVRRSELSEHEIYCECNPQKRCRTCGSDVLIGCEHNCIKSLLNRNKMIDKELSELKAENERLKANQTNFLDISGFNGLERNVFRDLVTTYGQLPDNLDHPDRPMMLSEVTSLISEVNNISIPTGAQSNAHIDIL